MSIKFSLKKKIAAGALVAAGLVGATAGYAYFTTTGSGVGGGAVGHDSAMTIHQVNVVYSNGSTENAFEPGTTATLTFTADNPSSGHELLNKIHLASWTSNKPGCNKSTDGDPTAETSWITMSDVTVNSDYGPGLGQAVTPTGTVTFNNLTTTDQSACKDATLTFNFTSN